MKIAAAIALMLAVVVNPHPSNAHSVLVSSRPAAHETLAGPGVDIVLTFDSRIDGARSRLVIKRPAAKPLVLTPALGPGKNSLSAHADDLAPGEYTLDYAVLSIDGHLARGSLPFTVVPR